MKNQSIGFIGGGRITRIFLQAFTNAGVSFDSIAVFDINPEVTSKLKKAYPQVTITNMEEASAQPIVFLALHPPVLMEFLSNQSVTINESIIVSLAPKITIAKIASVLNNEQIVRMIPNATSYINEGYNPITFADSIPADLKASVLNLLKSLGKTIEVAEKKLEAYAILSAMLPTYFWFQWNKLEAIGVEMGMTPEESKETLKNTLIGAIHLLYDSNLPFEGVNDLIPVKPIAEHQSQIEEIYQTKLLGLFDKIKP